MNEQTLHRLRHLWLGWIAMLAFASVLTPIHVHIVIAQDAPEIVIAPADPGEPPTPPQTPAEAVLETAKVQADLPSVSEPALDQPVIDEPVIAEPVIDKPAIETLADETAIQTPDVPNTPSEISSEAEIDKLIPTGESQAESVTSEQRQSDLNSVRTLSIEPGVRMLPEDRPAWVGAAPDYSAAIHHLYVGSLPTSSQSDIDESLDAPLVEAVRTYIDQEVVNERNASINMPIDAKFIRRNLIDEPSGFVCEISTSQGAMFQKWVAVHITPEQRKLFAKWHTEASQRSRLAPIGLGLVSILALVSLSHVVLRRRHGAGNLPFVNRHSPEPEVVVRRSRSWTAFMVLVFLLFLMIPAFFMFAALMLVRTHVSTAEVHRQADDRDRAQSMANDLQKEVRVETLNGGQRTVIIESQSHR